ncbi:hypothetical protein [Ulvibacterium sp.]|uniref:hypothetical protein n=1 Tax=Ulvibacterium sp. TaxID=2665914 RepID=UPI00261A37CE|nr:hypothetical protein [Ulvibacterium sp.]
MEIAIGIIGLIIAILTFYYSFFRKPKEELDNLKIQFKPTQQLSKKLQVELENYINATDSWNHPMFPNISFGAYLTEMKESYKENLSDDLYKKLDTLNLTKPIIRSRTKSLETQFNALQQLQIELRIRSRKVLHNES